jgi:hypothetical protein
MLQKKYKYKYLLTKNNFLLFSLTFLILVFSFAFAFSAVKAEDTPISIGVSPAISDIKISSGKKVTKTILVTNNGTDALAIRSYAENFEAANPFGGIKFSTDTTTQYSSMTWLDIKDKNMIIDPGQKKELTIVIDCPKDAEPGGHYSVVFLEPVGAVSSGDNSNVGISQRVGALLFITVEGNNKESGQVLGASTSDKCIGVQCSFKSDPFLEWGPVPFTFTFENTGNIHVKASGTIEIFNNFGKKVDEIPVDEKTVLPGSKRTFEAKWLREVLLGKYTAKLTVRYGSGNSVQRATTSFFVLPWKSILSALILILVIIFGIIFVKNKSTKKLLHERIFGKNKHKKRL